MTTIGELSLWIALLAATWSAVVSVAGARRRRDDLIVSGRRASVVALALTAIAAVALWVALLTPDFSLAYVSSQVTTSMSRMLAVTAFWSGREGALLFTSLLLATFAVFAGRAGQSSAAGSMPWVTGALSCVLAFLLATTAFHANPFTRLDWLPVDGQGMPPHFRQPGIVLHLAAMSAGYAMAAVPFALAVGALVSGRLGDLRVARAWSAGSWSVLSAGMTLGMWSAYAERGTGVLWSWEAAEVASLAPWLAGAALHAIPATARRSILLMLAMFLLSIPGALMSRAVGAAPPLAMVVWTSVFLAAGLAACAWLVAARLSRIAAPGARIGGEGRLARRVVYVGALALGVALVGIRFRQAHDATLSPGQAFQVTDPLGGEWRFVSQGVSTDRTRSYLLTAVALAASRNGVSAGLVTTEQRQYVDAQQRYVYEPSSVPGVRTGLLRDVQVEILTARGDSADLRIRFVPLVVWAWVGGVLMVLGGLGAVGAARAGPPPPEPESVSEVDVEARVRTMRASHRECATCGIRPEADAEFCSTCGAELAPP